VENLNMAGMKDIELIRYIVGGRRDLFADLIAPHLRLPTRAIQTTIGSSRDLDDIVQQNTLTALIHLSKVRFEASFRTWLIRIGLNEARQWRRKCVSSRLLALDLPTLTQLPAACARASQLIECQGSEPIGRLRAAITRLPEKHRVIVPLRDLDDLGISEVARRLGLTTPGVKTRQLRARLKMGKFLGPLCQPPPLRSRACR
jgi:RNA polymerase sigma factor (sigma-70 family)